MSIYWYNSIHNNKYRLGTFVTGYPFYILNKELNGNLPVIQEQIRYNKELITRAKTTPTKRWTCAECLTEKQRIMPDFKRICKPWPNIKKDLKQIKEINNIIQNNNKDQ